MRAGSAGSIEYRRAIEALRNGVPNADAVRVMGCGQQAVEQYFAEQLDSVDAHFEEGKQSPGLLVAGGFGSGKSHLLEYLEHRALSENFVCSRVVISKETPLYDPSKVYRAAVGSAVVPGRTGQAIQEIALGLRENSPEYAAFYQWAVNPGSGLSAIFPATLFLHERVRKDIEMIEQITNFWAGDHIPVARVRQGLKEVGASTMFTLRAVKLAQLALERFVFVARLIRGAGYRGWVLLFDEIELIGRYSLLQRGKSYAEIACWLGKVKDRQIPGLTALAAITDDFAAHVLDEKGDYSNIGEKLRSKGSDEMTLLAARAELGMRSIRREAVSLAPPDEATLESTYHRLKEVHGGAYGWSPPDIAPAERSLRRAMRSHVRRWINEWDLKRLYPGADVVTEEEELRPTYEEDVEIERPSEADEPNND